MIGVGLASGSPCYSVDISEFVGYANVQFMFETVRVLGNNVFIDNVSVDALTEVQENDGLLHKLQVYPNPSNGLMTIDFGENPDNAKITAFNIQGQLIYESEMISGQKSIQVDFRAQPKGLYFINVLTDGLSSTRKVLVR